jgi:threonine synthase
LAYFVKDSQRKVTVLVATSGDTGGAVAAGFYDVPGVEVVILYPSGKVSPVQEKQLTTLGRNIRALEVNGSFDDCQRIVKQAFADPELNQRFFLTSANSINVARWLPQQFYYFFAAKQAQQLATPPVIAVPSGNFGNICAGILAWASGLPVKHFIAACNENDTVTRYLQSGSWEPQPPVATLSNAMDVALPSNFVRIMELFHQQLPELKHMLSSVKVSDATTLEVIRYVQEESGYLLDPHGAVAYEALVNYLQHHPGQWGYLLETAHPVKFPDAIEQATGATVPIPASLEGLMQKEKKAVVIEASYEAFTAVL